MAFCQRAVECGAIPSTDGCTSLIDTCPDLVFAPGSTRTIDSTTTLDAFTGGPAWCEPDSMCNPTPSPPTCEALPAPGEPCDRFCSQGTSCECDDDGCITRTCVVERFPGERCDAVGDRCVASTCEAGRCVPSASQRLFETTCP